LIVVRNYQRSTNIHNFSRNITLQRTFVQTQSEAFHQLMEHPWQSSVVSYIPVFPIVTPEWIDGAMGGGAHAFSRSMPGFIHEQWPSVGKRTLIDPFRLGWLLDILVRVKTLPGDIVECGTWKGGSGLLMALALKRLGIRKQVHLFDSFEGLPEPDREWDRGYSRGMFRGDHEALLRQIRRLKLDDFVTVHKGWFSATLPAFLAGAPPGIALLHIDCDLYHSTMDCLNALYPLLAEGGAVVFDDLNDGCRGEKRAVQTFLAGARTGIHIGPAPQGYFFKNGGKGDDLDPGRYVYTEGSLSYCFDTLLADEDYLAWLNRQLGYDYKKSVEGFITLAAGC
jgi:hypothetical protein